jgi:FkbM family methyltransferase
MPRNIFIDLGCHHFETYGMLYDSDGNLKYDKKNQRQFFNKNIHISDLDFYLFECLPSCFDKIEHYKKNLENKFGSIVFFIKSAISTKNGNAKFYESIDKWGNFGSTLRRDKREKLDLNNPIDVTTIDIVDFINIFSKDDYIIVKMDIEGAEYDILEHLLKRPDAYNKINELHVEWHSQFFINGKKMENELQKKINKTNMSYYPWLY